MNELTDSMILYWIDVHTQDPHYEVFAEGSNQISDALDRCFQLRKEGHLFVTTASHSSDLGGIVRDGKLPDGRPYTWKKRRI